MWCFESEGMDTQGDAAIPHTFERHAAQLCHSLLLVQYVFGLGHQRLVRLRSAHVREPEPCSPPPPPSDQEKDPVTMHPLGKEAEVPVPGMYTCVAHNDSDGS